MTDHDAFWHEMAESTSPQRLGHEPDEHLLDSILDRQPLPPSAAHGMQVLTGKLGELAAPGGAGMLAGEAAAMSEFRRRFSPASTLPLSLPDAPVDRAAAAVRGRVRRWRVAGRARVAGVVAVIAVILGGGSVAAYAGALPAPVQELAHTLIGAPAARHGPASHDHGNHAGPSRAPGQQPSSAAGKAKGHSHSAAHGKAAGHRKHQHAAHPAHAGKKSGKKKHSSTHVPAAPKG